MFNVAGMAEMKPTRRPLLITLTPQCQSRRQPGGCNALKLQSAPVFTKNTQQPLTIWWNSADNRI